MVLVYGWSVSGAVNLMSPLDSSKKTGNSCCMVSSWIPKSGGIPPPPLLGPSISPLQLLGDAQMPPPPTTLQACLGPCVWLLS